MNWNNNIEAFLTILRAGLWDEKICMKEYGELDYNGLLQLAQEQSVLGLFLSGLENITTVLKPPKKQLLEMMGQVLMIEQKNKEMNDFIASLFILLKKNGIKAMLVKGQGVAQCYIKPYWRMSGDVDLLLDAENYKRCKALILPLASDAESEDTYRMHIGLMINGWLVELHGSMRTDMLKDMDIVVDQVQEDVFKNSSFRIWKLQNVEIQLPTPDNDVVFVFSHILQHYYFEGVGLRQICDWCRLLWTYHSVLDIELLEQRLQMMGMETEWKTFAALAVHWLGMPKEAMPLYSDSQRHSGREKRLMKFIIRSGNFGHNRNNSYLEKYPKTIRHFFLFCSYSGNSIRRFSIFPKNSMKAWTGWITMGIRRGVLGKK